jgi:hypothetical protein
MSSRPPREPRAAAWGATVQPQLDEERHRARRMLWAAAIATLAVGVVLVWALVSTPESGPEPLTVVAVALAFVTILYGIEVVAGTRRAGRLARIASSEDQQRRTLTADLEQLEAIDVVARRLAGAVTLPEAVESILAGARGLVPAVSGAVLLDAADDLQVSMTGAAHVTGAAAVSAGGHELAARALARGVALRGGHDAALEEHGAPSRLAVPLRASTEVVGVLVLERSTDSTGFSPWEQRVLERLAPHAALALVRTGHLDDQAVTPVAAASPTPPEDAGVAATVDLSEVVREVAGVLSSSRQGGRRIAILASSPAPTRCDRSALRLALEGVLRALDRSMPPDGAMAIEILSVGPDWEVAIAHAGEVLPARLLEEPSPDAPGGASVRELAEELGGAVTARERSGMAQLRFRVPAVGAPAAPQPRRSPETAVVS